MNFSPNHPTKSCFFFRSSSDSFILSGENTRRWCNGMFSNNIRALAPKKGNRSGYCNPKGHILGLLDTYCLEENRFLIVLDGVSQDDFEGKFAPYMALDDIELDDEQNGILSIQGPDAESILSKIGYTIPQEQDVHEFSDGFILRKDRFGNRRSNHGFDIRTSKPEEFIHALQNLGIPEFSVEEQLAHRILSGSASFPADFDDKTFFHEVLLNEECCSFNKGCYVGQEIINRIDVKGAVTKKIHLFSSSVPFEPAEELFVEGKSVAKILSHCMSNGTFYALAMVRKQFWEQSLHRTKGLAEYISL